MKYESGFAGFAGLWDGQDAVRNNPGNPAMLEFLMRTTSKSKIGF